MGTVKRKFGDSFIFAEVRSGWGFEMPFVFSQGCVHCVVPF